MAKEEARAAWKGSEQGVEEANEEETLQHHCNEKADDHDDVYVLNEDFLTKRFSDHWGGGSVEDKKNVKKQLFKHTKHIALFPMTTSQPQC